MKNERREFIKKAAMGAAAVSFGGVLPGFSAKRYASIMGANDRINVAAMGVNARGFAVATITWEGRSCNGHHIEGSSVGVLFHGEKGSLLIDGGNSYKIFDLKNKVIKNVENDIKVDPRNAVNPSQQLDGFHIQNFFDGIRKGTAQNADILGGHQSTLLVQLGNIAQRSGKTLNINPDNGHIIDDREAVKYWSREYEPGWEPNT